MSYSCHVGHGFVYAAHNRGIYNEVARKASSKEGRNSFNS